MNKKLLKPIALILIAALLIGSSLAYFTDKATTQATGTAGTVAISLANNINFLDADGQDIINPGDQRAAAFAVTNEGNKSIDVRTTVALTAVDYNGAPIAFTGDADNQSEYDLYLASDVELVAGEGYKPKADAKPLQVKSIDQNIITYVLPIYSLNGNSDSYTEVETIADVDTFTHNYDLVMLMKGTSGNEWQASSIRMDVLVEAKQHENTAAGWTIVATENVTHGSINQDAVLAEDVITAGTPAPVVCTHTYDKYVTNNDGTHQVLCSKCDDVSNASEACPYVDGTCTKCGYIKPVTGPVVATFSDGEKLTWEELKYSSNGKKYGYDADSITDDNILNNAFKGCTDLNSIVIPEGVHFISSSAFANCTKLASVEIPFDMGIIETKAFENCTNLTEITYGGTQDEWENRVIKDAGWDDNAGPYAVICIDGIISNK